MVISFNNEIDFVGAVGEPKVVHSCRQLLCI